MIKVGIIGCGKIADAHMAQLGRIPDCKVVAGCDRELLMAEQLCERFNVPAAFSDVADLLEKARPDSVHITTPPGGHYALARQCLEAGCHVYVEKPFTVTAAETEDLLALAEKKGRKITVGHDLQFSHVAREMRQLVAEGWLGGSPIHMECCYCYDLSEPRYARALLGDKNHWVRALPGKLLHNIISHGVAKIAEFLEDAEFTVIAHGFSSPMLKSIGEGEIVDELRVIISQRERLTAYFTFSSQMRPALNEFRIYGPKNGLLLDEEQQTLIRLRGNRLKSYAEKFVSPLRQAGRYVKSVSGNLRKFLRNDFHMKAGMGALINAFYSSIRNNGPIPIPSAQIRMTARIMEEIFRQIYPENCPEAPEGGASGARDRLNGESQPELAVERRNA